MAYWASLQKSEGGGGGTDGVKGGGGHILAVNDCVSTELKQDDAESQGLIKQYGGTARFLSRAIQPTGVEVTYLDFEAAGEEGIRKAIRSDTRVCASGNYHLGKVRGIEFELILSSFSG